MPRLESEEQILDEDFRKMVIDEMIDGTENLERKADALRRHEIYRDQNKKWVVKALENEGFKKETIAQMANRATNISVAKKIVNKLSQTYVGGVIRKTEEESAQESVDQLADEMDFDSKMKKSDRYRQLFRNTLVGVIPKKDTLSELQNDEEKFALAMKVLAPWQYDVIEDPNDPEKPLVIILTDFPEREQFNTTTEEHSRGAQGFRTTGTRKEGDGIEQIIADDPADKGKEDDNRKFIWWSPRFHLTTNSQGVRLEESPEEDLNPIQKLPWQSIHTDQDGNYWAEGGDDVIEGSILINKKLTDVNYISFVQGWGQLVISGKNIPKVLQGGPDNAFVFQVENDDPNPQVFFASSNPDISSWLETVKMILALLLSTNDLSVRNIAAKLDAENAASGIALLIENSEVMVNTKDVQKEYQDIEPGLWEITRRWHELLSDLDALVPAFQEIDTFEETDVSLKFISVQAPISPKESLEELKIRKDLGLDTLIDLIRRDNPDMDEDEAKEKATELMNEKKANMERMAGQMIKKQLPMTGKEDDDGETDEEKAKKAEADEKVEALSEE